MIIRCPENYQTIDFLNNQKKIRKSFLEKKKIKKFKFLRKINDSIKDFFRNFAKINKILLTGKRKNTAYAAVICYGGIGDILRYKAVILELIKMCPDIVIDVYNKAALPLFKDIENIRFYLNINAVNFIRKCYDVVYKLDYFTADTLLIKKGKKLTDKLLENFSIYKDKYPFCFNISRIYGNDDLINNNITIVNLLKITAGVDNVSDISFTIKPKELSLSKFGIDNNTLYLTFQCGAGGNGKLDNAKCWDIENWKKLLAVLKMNLSRNIKFVQIGTGIVHISEADINLSGKTSLDEVFCILKQSLFHIDIDGACSHIAKAVGTKSLIMFGPTDSAFSAYPENINICSSLCGSCWTNGAKCPIGHEKNLCMESITPEFVAAKVCEYLSTVKPNIDIEETAHTFDRGKRFNILPDIPQLGVKGR
jgi:ADP-heptose:LPS heptosyltransferase